MPISKRRLRTGLARLRHPKKQINVRLTEDEAEILEWLAARWERSQAYIVGWLLKSRRDYEDKVLKTDLELGLHPLKTGRRSRRKNAGTGWMIADFETWRKTRSNKESSR
jgi:hypothetical protein